MILVTGRYLHEAVNESAQPDEPIKEWGALNPEVQSRYEATAGALNARLAQIERNSIMDDQQQQPEEIETPCSVDESGNTPRFTVGFVIVFLALLASLAGSVGAFLIGWYAFTGDTAQFLVIGGAALFIASFVALLACVREGARREGFID